MYKTHTLTHTHRNVKQISSDGNAFSLRRCRTQKLLTDLEVFTGQLHQQGGGATEESTSTPLQGVDLDPWITDPTAGGPERLGSASAAFSSVLFFSVFFIKDEKNQTSWAGFNHPGY